MPQTSPLPDDILDPPVPETVLLNIAAASKPYPVASQAPETWNDHEALLLGFAQALQRKLHAGILEDHVAITKTLDGVLVAMRGTIEALSTGNDHATAQLNTLLEKLCGSGVVILQNPYHATVQAKSPQGYAVTLEVSKAEAGTLMQSVDGVLGWLAAQGYTPLLP